jgi:hypothetical protein
MDASNSYEAEASLFRLLFQYNCKIRLLELAQQITFLNTVTHDPSSSPDVNV